MFQFVYASSLLVSDNSGVRTIIQQIQPFIHIVVPQLQVKLCSVKMNMSINSGKQVDRVDRFSAESSRSTESTKVESIDRVDRFQGLSNTIQQICKK